MRLTDTEQYKITQLQHHTYEVCQLQGSHGLVRPQLHAPVNVLC